MNIGHMFPDALVRKAASILIALVSYAVLSICGIGNAHAAMFCGVPNINDVKSLAGGGTEYSHEMNARAACETSPAVVWTSTPGVGDHIFNFAGCAPEGGGDKRWRANYGPSTTKKYADCSTVTGQAAWTTSTTGWPWTTAGCPSGQTWSDVMRTCLAYDSDKNLGPEDCQTQKTHCGNPINVAIGNKYQRVDDLQISSLLSFSRHYNSQAAAKSNLLGPQWAHTYARSVEYQGAGTATPTAIVSRPEGGRVTFRYISGQWQADADVIARLVRIDGASGELLGWTYTPRDGREVEDYDTLGRLLQITKADGSTITLTYNNGVIANNADDLRLTRVQGQDGRSLMFEYDPSRRISRINDSAGDVYVYGYDASGRLETVTYPGGAQRRYHYNEPVHTSGANLPNALTGITHEDGQRYATFAYAANRRAISTEHAGGVDKFAVQYNADGTANITGPLNATQQRTFTTLLGVKKATSIVEQCAGCTARTTSYSYDANGRPDIVTDPAGTTTDYDYNARGLVDRKVDSANKASAKRIIQADWHPAFAVPSERRTYDATNALIAKTTWAYNSRGQALAQTQIDPATGATRTSTTAYCEQPDIDAGTCPLLGLVKSVNGSRTDVSDITTYTYYPSDDASCATTPTTCPHRKGDLWKFINALGQVTETVKYDGAGRTLSMKDANEVVTELEYHPRGWLTARKVRGSDSSVETDDAITRIEYWSTGLVKKVVQPDGAFTAYTYDAAHD